MRRPFRSGKSIQADLTMLVFILSFAFTAGIVLGLGAVWLIDLNAGRLAGFLQGQGVASGHHPALPGLVEQVFTPGVISSVVLVVSGGLVALNHHRRHGGTDGVDSPA